MTLNGYLAIIGVILGVIGAISALWFLCEKLLPWRRLSWRFAEKTANTIAEKMTAEDFLPTVVIGIGRGGAVMGSLISGAFGHRPLLVVDRKYFWQHGRRLDDMILRIRFPPQLIEKVLLVAGEAHSGNTLRLYFDFFLCIGAKQIRRAVLYYQKGCPEPVEYFGIKSSRDLRMPWMYTNKYVRQDRGNTETNSLLAKINLTNIQTSERHCFLVRHGKSTDNEAGDRFSGITDCDLTEKGLLQAEEVGKKLQLEHVEYIYTSPMKRAIETARKLQLQTGGALVIDRRLREIDYGNWEGLTRQEVFQKWPDLYAKWKQDPIFFFPCNAENPKLALERIVNFWDDIRTKLVSEDVKVIVVVSHKSILRLLISYINSEPLQKYREHLSYNCSISKIILDKHGNNARIAYENQIDHLSGMD